MLRRVFSCCVSLPLLGLLPFLIACQGKTEPETPEEEQPVEQRINPYAANCYIARASGTISFPAYQGNSFVPVGEIASVEVLWESDLSDTAPAPGSLIQAVEYIPAQEEGTVGRIYYTVPQPMKNGNAVIAAKDADGKILWSWHIWLCQDYDPDLSAQAYYNNAGIMMDRNLGATSTTPGDFAALGLLYQWGRKDPFLGSYDIEAARPAASTGEWSVTTSSPLHGTIAYAIEHPMTFIASGLDNGDWLYGETEWDRTHSTDFTRWGASKTIYDPCPPGWRVPDEDDQENIWTRAFGSTDQFKEWGYDLLNLGINFYKKLGESDPIWYPLPGYILGHTGVMSLGILVNVSGFGMWWSCGGKHYLYIDHLSSKSIRPFESNWTYHAFGCSVRCQKDVPPQED